MPFNLIPASPPAPSLLSLLLSTLHSLCGPLQQGTKMPPSSAFDDLLPKGQFDLGAGDQISTQEKSHPQPQEET